MLTAKIPAMKASATKVPAKKVVGFAGWSGSGKTKLVVALIQEFSRQGLRVSTIKHAHHSFDIDHKGKDSYAHRNAGAHEVLVVSSRRWALMHECSPEETTDTRWLSPTALQRHLAPVDVLLVEGFKSAPLDKLEIRRQSLHPKAQPPLAQQDPRIRAIVSDTPLLQHTLPVFDADAPAPIAEFVLHSGFFLPSVESPPAPSDAT